MLLLCAECSAGDLVLLYKLDDISIQAHSMRSATNNNRWSATLYTISIHALHAECDDTLIFAQHLRSTISIHALHAECDLVWEILATVPETNFNPRTPCGVRRQQTGIVYGMELFQSTHSMRSATKVRMKVGDGISISIHALHAECDIVRKSSLLTSKNFNPRTPCGVQRKHRK